VLIPHLPWAGHRILAQLALLMGEGKLKKQPIYIGGLAVFTEIYDLEAHRRIDPSGLQLHDHWS